MEVDSMSVMGLWKICVALPGCEQEQKSENGLQNDLWAKKKSKKIWSLTQF